MNTVYSHIVNQIDISHYNLSHENLNIVLPGDLITAEEGYMKYFYCYLIVGMEPTRLIIRFILPLWGQSK